jgi:alginate O-acetyltransferase complex protein AlgI
VLFNSVSFGLFLAAVLSLYFAAPRKWRGRVLLGASLVFYALWIPTYLLLLLLDVAVNYGLMQWMLRSRRPKIPLALACTFTLGLLAYFKYAAMLIESLAPVLQRLSVAVPDAPDIFLPLGISFYSFQILSLTIDCHRGGIRPDSFSQYLLYISFFPQLIAGPIVRGHQLLPQLARGGAPNLERARRGLWLISLGLLKKVVLADFLLAPFVDMVFGPPDLTSSSFHLIALYSFAFQIYFDFSGYCDIARGVALLFGFELPLNFLEPYLARGPSEFWRSWHVTLSRWLADYVYIPIGGNRRGSSRTLVNLMLTMLLGGLWHGASWTFVVWGGLHGLLLIAYRLMQGQQRSERSPLTWGDPIRIFLFFHFVCFCWVFFRAESLHAAWRYLQVLLAFENPHGWPWTQVAVVALCALAHAFERIARTRAESMRDWLSARTLLGAGIEGAAMGVTAILVLLTSGVGGDFIYFQF